MALVTATDTQLTDFLTKYGYSVTEDRAVLLALSFAFLSTLPFCADIEPDADTVVEAQCFIAYSISENGGGFNPAAIAEAKTLIKKGMGRGAITKEFQVNELLNGSDPMSQLRSMPLAFGLLKGYLCYGCAGVFVV